MATKHEAGKCEQYMRNIMRVFSHDLRNPLLNIQALAQEAGMLLKDAVQAGQKGNRDALSQILKGELPEILELLSHSARGMDDMVLGANEIYHCLFDALDCEVVDMRTLFLRCFAQLKLADEQARLDCPDLPAVYADELAARRIVWELLRNAWQSMMVKGLPCDRTIRVQAEAEEGMVVFTVRDSGCGLTEDEIAHAFDAFFSGQRFSGHMGMGLVRARILVERHGGLMVLENHEEGGAVARFSLPKTP